MPVANNSELCWLCHMMLEHNQRVSERNPLTLFAVILLAQQSERPCIAAPIIFSGLRCVQFGVNLANSGTTACVAYQLGNRLWVASAGDSRTILCSRDTHDEWRAVPLTLDHRPRRTSERERWVIRWLVSCVGMYACSGLQAGLAMLQWPPCDTVTVMFIYCSMHSIAICACSTCRVQAAGARVAPKRLPSGRSVGEPRLWLQNAHGPGLMLSR